jgi:hypothetical protein
VWRGQCSYQRTAFRGGKRIQVQTKPEADFLHVQRYWNKLVDHRSRNKTMTAHPSHVQGQMKVSNSVQVVVMPYDRSPEAISCNESVTKETRFPTALLGWAKYVHLSWSIPCLTHASALNSPVACTPRSLCPVCFWPLQQGDGLRCWLQQYTLGPPQYPPCFQSLAGGCVHCPLMQRPHLGQPCKKVLEIVHAGHGWSAGPAGQLPL